MIVDILISSYISILIGLQYSLLFYISKVSKLLKTIEMSFYKAYMYLVISFLCDLKNIVELEFTPNKKKEKKYWHISFLVRNPKQLRLSSMAINL